MKKLVALLLAFAMLLSLAACGGGEKAEDPNAGEYQGVSVSMMGIELGMDEVYPGENKLVLKSNGKLELILEGDKIPGSWKLDGETLDMTIEGEKCPGTLKNGVVVFDLAGSGVILTFARDGASAGPAPTNQPDEPESTEEAQAAGPLGVYLGTTYEYADQSFRMEDIYDGTNSIELMEGGKAVFFLAGGEMQGTWELNGEEFSIDCQGLESSGILKDGVISLDYMNLGMIMTFVMEGSTAQVPGGNEAAPGEGAFPDVFIEDHQGDWHGMAIVYEGTGVFEDEVEKEMEIIARLAFREDGSCEPYLACAFGGKDNNFKNLTAAYNESGDVMNLSGEFVNEVLTESSNLFVLDGVLYVDVYVDDGEGNSMNLYAALRRLDDTWDYENDWLALSEDAVAFYKGKSFMEIAELFKVKPDEIPALDGQEAAGNEPATGAGILDYDTIAEVYDWVLFYSSKENNYGKAPYAEIVERMGGVEGAPANEELWNEKTRFYKWGISEDEFIKLTFQLKDGVWVHCGSTNTTAFMDIYNSYYG